MECQWIPYSRVPKSSSLFLDFVYQFNKVARFYTASPFDFSSYKNLSSSLGDSSKNRRPLIEILTRQNKAFGCGEQTLDNIRRLGEPGTFAVVTGQQVGLFSGPAFTLYKALTAVKLAQWLSGQGLPSVPVFWLATEDHDLEEVARTAVLDEEYQGVELGDEGQRPSPQSSVGYVKLSDNITAALDRLESALPAGGPREILLADLRASYQPGAFWGGSFARFITRLFSKWGVILLDPLTDSIHQLATSIYEKSLLQAPLLRGRLQERSEELVRAGYHAQVHVAEDSTMLFVERGGDRTSVHERAGNFSFHDGEGLDLADLRARLKSRPIEFTANALLRPVVQDLLLPTVAYIAGPSELTYHAQSQVLYEAFGRPQPLIFPRAAFTLIDRRTQRLLEKYHLQVDDVWQGEEHLRRALAASAFGEAGAGGWSERMDETVRELDRLLERLRGDVEALDPTLVDPVKHTREKMAQQMDRLKGKISRAVLERSELAGKHEQALARFLTPAGDLQEREVSGVYFLGRAGYDLLDALLARIQTNSSDYQLLVY